MSPAAGALTGLHWHADGYASLSGPLLALAGALDRRFLACAATAPLVEHAAPSFIALADLEPLGYLGSFPHLATFATTLSRDAGALRDFAAAHGRSTTIPPQVNWEPARQVLTPAACYHLYHRLRHQALPEDTYLTIRAHCHRCEASYAPLARQWCFQMRELVCIGAAASVESFVAGCKARIDALARTLGIAAEWRLATDPFFDPDEDPKALAQRVAPVKTELTLSDGLAITSINRHGSYFGERYGITRAGEPAHSACVAFGIERWLLALIRVRGPRPESWCFDAAAAA